MIKCKCSKELTPQHAQQEWTKYIASLTDQSLNELKSIPTLNGYWNRIGKNKFNIRDWKIGSANAKELYNEMQNIKNQVVDAVLLFGSLNPKSNNLIIFYLKAINIEMSEQYQINKLNASGDIQEAPTIINDVKPVEARPKAKRLDYE